MPEHAKLAPIYICLYLSPPPPGCSCGYIHPQCEKSIFLSAHLYVWCSRCSAFRVSFPKTVTTLLGIDSRRADPILCSLLYWNTYTPFNLAILKATMNQTLHSLVTKPKQMHVAKLIMYIPTCSSQSQHHCLCIS